MRTLHPATDVPGTAPGACSAAAREVLIPQGGGLRLPGELSPPAAGEGIVVFVHGSGSSRHSPRDRAVATTLRALGLGTLQFDLRTADEESLDRVIGWLRFDPEQLARRVLHAIQWLARQPGCEGRRVGLFGAGSGAAAALLAAAEAPQQVSAVVCRGGRPDLCGTAISAVRTPTLLLVGDHDAATLGMNRWAMAQLQCDRELVVIAGASHLFREPGALDQVASLSATWLRGFLSAELTRH